MTTYKIMCNIFFPSQDGWDYHTEEADGIEYRSYEEASKKKEAYVRSCSPTYDFYIIKEDK